MPVLFDDLINKGHTSFLLYSFQSVEQIVLSYHVCFFLIIISAISIIFSFNPVYSVIFLILCFIETSVLFLMFQIEFIALILIIVYLGAVCVLFLFIIMMLNIKILELRREINFVPFSFFIISFLFLSNNLFDNSFLDSNRIFLLSKIFDIFFFYTKQYYIQSDIYFSVLEIPNSFAADSLKKIGFILYTFFSSHFIIASFILLVAMLGSIFLTLEITSKSKKQDLFAQLTKNKGFKN